MRDQPNCNKCAHNKSFFFAMRLIKLQEFVHIFLRIAHRTSAWNNSSSSTSKSCNCNKKARNGCLISKNSWLRRTLLAFLEMLSIIKIIFFICKEKMISLQNVKLYQQDSFWYLTTNGRHSCSRIMSPTLFACSNMITAFCSVKVLLRCTRQFSATSLSRNLTAM